MSVNRELAALRRMFHLGKKHKKVASIPDIEMLKEPPARKGFLEHEQYRNLRNALPEHLKPVLTAFYFTGMRLNELVSITWEQVNLNEREIRLDPGTTKNDEGRTLILDGEFLEVMRMQRDKHNNEHSGCQWVFFRRGKRIKNFYKAWRTACVKAGLGTLERQENGQLKYSGLIPHDLRRTAVRNLVRAGVPERVAMEISGHKTRAIFERYNIVSRRDLQEAARRQSEYLAEKNNQSTDKITLPGHDQQATTAVSHWKN